MLISWETSYLILTGWGEQRAGKKTLESACLVHQELD